MRDPIQDIAWQLGIRTFGDGLLTKIRETIDLLQSDANNLMQYKEVAAELEAELAALKAKAAVPVGWRVEPIYDNGVDGFIVGTPRVGGVRTNTSVFPDDDDPAHSLLAIMLAAAPAQPQSDGVLMPVSDVEEYISLLIDEADAHLHGRHQPEMQAHMRAEIERVRALLGGEA